MDLRQASVTNPVTNVILDEMYMAAPVLDDIEFYMRDGNAPTMKKGREPGSGEVGFRNLNEDQTSTGPEREDVPQPKKILGYEAKVDRVLEDRNEDVDAELEQETRLKGEEAGYLFQESFFEGDAAVNPKQFDGLRVLTPATNVYSPADGTGAAAPLELKLGGDSVRTSQQQFMEEFLRFLRRVPGGATHAYLSDDFLIRMVIVAKALGYYRQSKDELGNTVDMVLGTVLRSAGRRYNGDPFLPASETYGGQADCMSAFAVRHAEARHLTFLTSVGVNADYEGMRGKFYVNTMDFDATSVLQHDAAVHQFQGIRLPSA